MDKRVIKRLVKEIKSLFVKIYIEIGIFIYCHIRIIRKSRIDYQQLLRTKDSDTGRYLNRLKSIHKRSEDRIKKKDSISIAFQICSMSTWVGNDVVELFNSDPRFQCSVIYIWQINMDKSRELDDIKTHFSDGKIEFIICDDSVDVSKYDIVFFTTPYIELLEHWKLKIPISSLLCYIPYGFYIASIQKIQFDLAIHNILWKNFVPSKFYMNMARDYCGIKMYGMVYSGYPKIDKLCQPTSIDVKYWKYTGKKNNVKRIIYAPHHSINNEPFVSTFAYNYKFFLEYAKTHQESTSWVFKPHPLLRIAAVKEGVFKNYKQYDDYCDEWNRLSNAKTVEGSYMEYFITSDAMILDSCSFVAEYLYVKKPILFLTRKGEKFNEFGERLIDVIYRANGQDYDAITAFIETTIDLDYEYEKRVAFYNDYLNYIADNGISAAEYIYKHIKGVLVS